MLVTQLLLVAVQPASPGALTCEQPRLQQREQLFATAVRRVCRALTCPVLATSGCAD